MIAREVPVQDVLRVVLQSGTQNLEEVVVTAIGMKKQEKAPSSMLHLNRANYFLTEFSGDWASGMTT